MIGDPRSSNEGMTRLRGASAFIHYGVTRLGNLRRGMQHSVAGRSEIGGAGSMLSAAQRQSPHAQSGLFHDDDRSASKYLRRLLKRNLEPFDHVRSPRIMQAK